MSPWIAPGLRLEGRLVVLEPLEPAHVEALLQPAAEPEMWSFFRTGPLLDVVRMRQWVEEAIALRERGIDYPFVTRELASGRLAGSTRFRLIDRTNLSLEIGGSWLGREYRGTGMNREAKRLMLEFAFEKLGAIRVQFRTDLRNLRSQRAIEALGATREGVLRKDFIYADGYQRSTVFYSILSEEWPAVRENWPRIG